MSGPPAVVGIADHRGWAILVCVAARKGVPVLLDRRRIELVAAGLPHQPYHHEVAELDTADAEQLVRRVAESAATHAQAALSQLRDDLGSQYRLVAISVWEGPTRPLPETFAEVQKSETALLAADGIMYRKALCDAARDLGIEVARHPRGAETARAALALGVDPARVEVFLGDVGRALGPPWRKEHRSAAAAAIGVLGQHARLDALDRRAAR